jgi:tRNA(Leu) C34 or U34 (ribose-2'-O)-methylase TrmL
MIMTPASLPLTAVRTFGFSADERRLRKTGIAIWDELAKSLVGEKIAEIHPYLLCASIIVTVFYRVHF